MHCGPGSGYSARPPLPAPSIPHPDNAGSLASGSPQPGRLSSSANRVRRGRPRLPHRVSHIRLKFALGHGEFTLRLLAPQVGLHNFAASRAPVPYGDIQCGSHSIAKVTRPIRFVHGEMRCINAVKVIERKRGKICALGGRLPRIWPLGKSLMRRERPDCGFALP